MRDRPNHNTNITGEKSVKPFSEISVEMRSIRTDTTGGYQRSLNSMSRDFEIDGQDEEMLDTVSDITALSRAVDEGPQERRGSKGGMLVPCALFIVSILAVLIFRGMGARNNDGDGNGDEISSNARIYGGEPGNNNYIDPISTDDSDNNPQSSESGGEGAGRIVEFLVANLNTNSQNCTHVRDTHVLQCIPQHNNSTNKFRIQLHPEWAPIGVERFEYLTTSEFWSDVRIFRVVPNFISQFGISSSPGVQESWSSMGNLKDDPATVSNTRGTVSFATSGKNTRTTQLFINLENNRFLNKQGFTPIGEVLPAADGYYGGMEVVDQFYSGYGEQPSQTRIREEGGDYLKEDFPLLSYFVKAEFVDQNDIFHA